MARDREIEGKSRWLKNKSPDKNLLKSFSLGFEKTCTYIQNQKKKEKERKEKKSKIGATLTAKSYHQK